MSAAKDLYLPGSVYRKKSCMMEFVLIMYFYMYKVPRHDASALGAPPLVILNPPKHDRNVCEL